MDELPWTSLTVEDRAALVALWHEELVRGWIPRAADIAAGLEVVGRQRTERRWTSMVTGNS